MKIHTFADGYGQWHAVVPAVGSVKGQRQRARRAIAAQMRARQGDQRPVVRLADTPPVTAAQRNPVRVWGEAA